MSRYTPGAPGDPAALSDFERAYIARNFPQPEPEISTPCVSCGEELDDCIARELRGLPQRFCCDDCEHVATRPRAGVPVVSEQAIVERYESLGATSEQAARWAAHELSSDEPTIVELADGRGAPGAPLDEHDAAHAALVRSFELPHIIEDVRLLAHTLAGLLDEATAQGEGYAAEIEEHHGHVGEHVAGHYTTGVLRAQLEIASQTLLRIAGQLSPTEG